MKDAPDPSVSEEITDIFTNYKIDNNNNNKKKKKKKKKKRFREFGAPIIYMIPVPLLT